MLTERGRSLLALGGLTYLGAWAFGAVPLYPVAIGLVVAVAGAAVWVRVLRRPLTLRRATGRAEHLAGTDVPVQLDVDVEGTMPLGTLVVREEIERLGEHEAPLRRWQGHLHGRYVLPSVPRGHYTIESSRVVVEDPFGLARADIELDHREPLLVYPRLVELSGLFSEAGGQSPGGRRLLLRRLTGFELHSVREYEQGESLRRVHWPSTARRGELMVKELEDAPRDEAAVLLDAEARAVAGEAPDTTFELAVRAAGSIVRAHAARGRRTSLVVSSPISAYQRVNSLDGDWQRALDILAAVEPNGHVHAAAFLADETGPATRALELTVVTAALTPRLVDRLLQRMLARHSASVVYVDPRSFAASGASPDRAVEAQLVRLARAGIPVAVLRRGGDLAGDLEGGRTPTVAVGGALA